MGRVRNWLAITMIVTVGATLSACASNRDNTTPMPVPTTTTSASPNAEPQTGPDPDPTMLPGGTALANHAYFDFINQRLLSVNNNPSGEAIISNLVAAGFAKVDMEITPDKTSQLRRPSDSIEFSVRVGDTCLIGQFEASSYVSLVGPALSGGRCLIGKTEPIQ